MSQPNATQTDYEARLAYCHRLIAAQGQALGTAHTALLHAAEAIKHHLADAFEVEGRPVGEVIDEAIAEIVS